MSEPQIQPLTQAERAELLSIDVDQELETWAGMASRLGYKWEVKHVWNEERYRGKMHASTFCKPCDMALYLERIGCKPRRKNSGRKQKIFDSGTAVHLIMNYYQNTRALHYGYQCQSEVWVGDEPISEELGICGSSDEKTTGWPLKRPVLWDYKSSNTRGFASLRNPSKEYVKQINTYMGCLGIAVGIICYYHKDTGHTLSFPIEFNAQLWKREIVTRAKLINQHAEKIDEGPQRKVSSYCFICPYFEDCEPPVPRRAARTAPQV